MSSASALTRARTGNPISKFEFAPAAGGGGGRGERVSKLGRFCLEVPLINARDPEMAAVGAIYTPARLEIDIPPSSRPISPKFSINLSLSLSLSLSRALFFFPINSEDIELLLALDISPLPLSLSLSLSLSVRLCPRQRKSNSERRSRRHAQFCRGVLTKRREGE